MKSKEELNALKEEVETLSRKLAELTEEELAQVTGGITNFLTAAGTNIDRDISFEKQEVGKNGKLYNFHIYK